MKIGNVHLRVVMDANELFEICTELAKKEPSPASAWRLRRVLSLTAAHGCDNVGGAFGNLFSQIDFLCKRLGVGISDTMAVQTARRRCREMVADKSWNKESWLLDVRAVVLFVSAVFGVSVPGTLRALLPSAGKPGVRAKAINKDYIRCIVGHFDASTIFAQSDGGELVIDYGNTEQGRDFLYLKKVLREGMQLNLLDCYLGEDGKVLPGQIVVEPDFLVDVSTLAVCFTTYGHHPLLYTLNRLKERSNSQAALLGNLAGVALDDMVKGVSGKATFRRAFRKDILRYCACDNFEPEKFKAEARQQMKNIGEAVEVLNADRKEGACLLEPSFVCERLGLQGRVDLMTVDMTLLVEQKSGKNMKIECRSHDAHGRQLESHYVQLLLYYGILKYNFQKSDRQVDTRLLYSRYPASEGLLSVNYYRALLREAIRLRNQVVATELLIAREGFGRIVPLLNAETIYKGVARDGFFHRYILPSLSLLNTQLSALTTLERIYFERMMTFVYREQVCQKLGSSEQRLHHSSGCTADLWLMPIDEKRLTGNIAMGLTIVRQEKSDPDGGYDLITLQSQPAAYNFRRGDMVYLYKYKEVPDVRNSILYKGSLDEIRDGMLTIRLNDGQQDESIFAPGGEARWAMEHGSSDAATAGCIRSLYHFVEADPSRRALLLGQREPQADMTEQLSHPYNPHYDDILSRIRQAQDYFLLVGPPGTGKTSMALRFMVEEYLQSSAPGRPSSILLSAYTNRAVDEICAMLTDAGFDYLRLGSISSCDPRYADRLLESGCDMPLSDMRRKIEQTPVIVSTTSMLLARPFIFSLKHFGMTIVDEASQILEPGLIGLLASDRIDRFVLIGDHKQLPAVVQQSEADARVDEQCLRGIGLADCRQSLFQRLYRWEKAQGRTQFVGTLDHQGRMHPDVALFPSRQFYEGRLLPVPVAHQMAGEIGYDLPSADKLDDLLKRQRVIFFPVVGNDIPDKAATGSLYEHGDTTQSNTAEALLVAELLRRIHRFYGERFDARKTVGVIVPYRNQIATIRSATEKLGIEELMGVSVDTVERYQGSQRDVIIYSFTVSRRYQLDFLCGNIYEENGNLIDRKLNVALTRARQQMLMVGNPHILAVNPLFQRLIDSYGVQSVPSV